MSPTYAVMGLTLAHSSHHCLGAGRGLGAANASDPARTSTGYTLGHACFVFVENGRR